MLSSAVLQLSKPPVRYQEAVLMTNVQKTEPVMSPLTWRVSLFLPRPRVLQTPCDRAALAGGREDWQGASYVTSDVVSMTRDAGTAYRRLANLSSSASDGGT